MPTDRRELLARAGALGALLAIGGCSGAEPRVRRAGPDDALEPVVRVSRGRYAPDLFDRVKAELVSAGYGLIPAIRRLPGCLHYYAGVDRRTSTIVNLSVWSSLAHAEQMASMSEMKAAGERFAALGVAFERPIANYELTWALG